MQVSPSTNIKFTNSSITVQKVVRGHQTRKTLNTEQWIKNNLNKESHINLLHRICSVDVRPPKEISMSGIIVSLIKKGVPLDQKDKDRSTPLLMATIAERDDIVSLLLNNGADLSIRNEFGMTPLDLAIIRGDLKTVIVLVKAGADVNEEGTDGRRPLHMATLLARHPICQILLQYGALINTQDGEGNTSLDLAGQIGSEHMFDLLDTIFYLDNKIIQATG